MADLAGIGIGSAIYRFASGNDSSADPGGKRDIEQRPVAAAGAMTGFAERTQVGVVVHDGPQAQRFLKLAREVKIAPSGDVRRQCNALSGELDGTTEPDSAAIDTIASLPSRSNRRNL